MNDSPNDSPKDAPNGSPSADPSPRVERLAASACWEYLQSAELGRLAVDNADGAPDIFPVNYVAHEGALYIRTARDAKLLHIAQHPMVAFEVDGATGDDDHYWSVVIRGKAERVTRDDEIRDSGVRQLASWSPTAKFFVMKVVANSVTGRRFPRHASRKDPLKAFEGDATLPTAPEPPRPPRAERPAPIPHFGPRTGPQDTIPGPRTDG
ncbi:pyridoxamine 5'-phosphate oxidase family protein [Microbacterium sp. NPDC056044]|uniref:pyridoxamine 5'-phosphate oxidase family protein n=1 Tax=Microbacterium sp. NPDC056044 TaxID=3345690 RepID=UPI0035E0DEF0